MPRFSTATILALTLGCAASPSGPAPTTPVAERYAVTPDGVRLYYRIAGTGPETVLAPFALFHDSALDPLARRGRRVVTYDPRGRGRSDSVPPEKVSLDLLLLDLETVRQAVGTERVALIGWSGGGMENFVYALRNPQHVTRLVQLAPVAPRFEPYGELMMKDRAARTDSAAKEKLDRRLASGEFRNDPAGRCRAQAAVSAPALFADPAHSPATPDVCRFPNEYPQRLGPYFQALFKSLDGFDWRDSLAAVTIPRLVIHGTRDNTPVAGNREWVAGQANARLFVIDGAGHWPHYEQPEVTLAAIDAFLSGRWPRGAIAVPFLSESRGRGTPPRTPSLEPDPVADQLLAGARRAIGEAGHVQSLSATAAVTGPSETFQAVVHSARDGRARLELGGHLLAGIGKQRGWIYDQVADSVARLDDTTRSVIRGHELHMLVLAPATRFGQPHNHGSRQRAGEAALAVEFHDVFGSPATLYLRARDTLPIGWELVNHTGEGVPEVLVAFAQWENVEGVRLFRRAVFTHGLNRYVYDYTRLRLNAAPDSTFEPPARATGEPHFDDAQRD